MIIDYYKLEDKYTILKSGDKNIVPKLEYEHMTPKSEVKHTVLKSEDIRHIGSIYFSNGKQFYGKALM